MNSVKQATLFCAVVAVLGTSVVMWQQRSLAVLRRDQKLGAINEAAADGTTITDAALQQDLIAMREQTRELPKLRNEIGQLRAVRSELAAARAENARLLEAKRTGALIPRESPPGFVSKERLAFAGFATPEAALETFFWSMREGNVVVAMESMSPENEDRVRFEQRSAKEREELANSFKTNVEGRGMGSFNDFTVAQREEISPDALALHIRSSVATNTFRFGLKRFGSEWKLTDMGPQGNGRAIGLPQISPRQSRIR